MHLTQHKQSLFALFLIGILLCAVFCGPGVFAKTEVEQYTQQSEEQSVYIANLINTTDGVLTHFDSNVELDTKGNATITEYITVYFPVQKHGITRWIPNEVILEDGTKLSQKISIVDIAYRRLPCAQNISLSSGAPCDNSESQDYTEYTQERKGAYEYLRIGDPDRYVQGGYQYKIVYTMKNAIRMNNTDYQELYLNITGDQWEIPILSASVSVQSHATIDKTVCYTGASGSSESYCTIATQGTTVVSKSTRIPAQGLTIGIKYPLQSFTGPSATDKLLELILYLSPLLMPLSAGLFAYSTWNKYGRDKNPAAIPPLFVPTNTMRKSNFSVMGSLLAMQFKPINAVAELVELARKGFLTLIVEKRKTAIAVTPEQKEKLIAYLETQPAYLELFVKLMTNSYQELTDLATLKSSASNATLMASINERVKSAVEKTVLYTPESKRAYNTVTFFLFGSIAVSFVLIMYLAATIISFIAAITTVIILFIGKTFMLQRSEEGNELYRDLLGLKRYIQTAEIERLEFFNNPQKLEAHFEEILPYAIILGLDKQWNATFADTLKQLEYNPSWLQSDRAYSNMYFLNSFSSINSSVASSMSRLATAPSSGSSSFGGGGGFSGGGSGGGGGGSW